MDKEKWFSKTVEETEKKFENKYRDGTFLGRRKKKARRKWF